MERLGAGRPDGTTIGRRRAIHYTCNAPRSETLEQYGIRAAGIRFGVAPREVLLIPLSVFTMFGYRPGGTIETEQLLRTLDHSHSK